MIYLYYYNNSIHLFISQQNNLNFSYIDLFIFILKLFNQFLSLYIESSNQHKLPIEENLYLNRYNIFYLFKSIKKNF